MHPLSSRSLPPQNHIPISAYVKPIHRARLGGVEIRDFYRASDPEEARGILDELKSPLPQTGHGTRGPKTWTHDPGWSDKICHYHLAKVTNGPTASLNNPIKSIERIGFGVRNFDNYRIRALLYAGRPNWRALGSIVVR